MILYLPLIARLHGLGDDFTDLGYANMRDLPFGCDETLFASPVQAGDTDAVLFFGGAPIPTGRRS